MSSRSSCWLCWPCSAVPGEVVRSLDYAHSSLHDVPDEVFTFERTLEELVLDSNRIRDLPRPLFLCQELRVLSISDNEVSALPPAVSALCSLQQLDASRNALRDVPSDIKACKRLACVNLSSNQLVRLPEGLTQLVALQELQLNDVELEFLPASVGRLALLRVLELRDNRLNSLPSSMSRLKQLTRLDIGHNEFRTWPSVLGSLYALAELWADLNELPALPAWVGNLHELQCMDASNNRISAIAPEIASCAKLVDLRLSYNELSRLPYTLGRLRHLATLKLDHNYLDQLPETIGDASALEELVAAHNQLDLVTPCLGFLRRLQLLDLDNNNLGEIPTELGSCRALTVLSLRRNRLLSIPPEIGHLPRIRVINLAENRLRNLPVSILNLSSLQALWLSDTQSAPLVQLHREYDVEQRCRVLTCLLLPQREDQGDEFPVDLGTPSGGGGGGMPVARRSACIRFSQDLTLEDEPGVLLRAPTPYPKELRTLARQAKQAARQSAARSSARQAEQADLSEVMPRPEADGKPHFVSEQILSPGLTTSSTVKEARVSRPQDPATLSRTNSVLQQEHCILREMAVTLGEPNPSPHARGQAWDQGQEMKEMYSHSSPPNHPSGLSNGPEPVYVKRSVTSGERDQGQKMEDMYSHSSTPNHSNGLPNGPEPVYVKRGIAGSERPPRIYEAKHEIREVVPEDQSHIVENVYGQRAASHDETHGSGRIASSPANRKTLGLEREESVKKEQWNNYMSPSNADMSAYASRELGDGSNANDSKVTSGFMANSECVNIYSRKEDLTKCGGNEESDQSSKCNESFTIYSASEKLNTTPLSYSSVYKDGTGRYGRKNEDVSIRRYENLSLFESNETSSASISGAEVNVETGTIPPIVTDRLMCASDTGGNSVLNNACAIDDVDSRCTTDSSNLESQYNFTVPEIHEVHGLKPKMEEEGSLMQRLGGSVIESHESHNVNHTEIETPNYAKANNNSGTLEREVPQESGLSDLKTSYQRRFVFPEKHAQVSQPDIPQTVQSPRKSREHHNSLKTAENQDGQNFQNEEETAPNPLQSNENMPAYTKQQFGFLSRSDSEQPRTMNNIVPEVSFGSRLVEQTSEDKQNAESCRNASSRIYEYRNGLSMVNNNAHAIGSDQLYDNSSQSSNTVNWQKTVDRNLNPLSERSDRIMSLKNSFKFEPVYGQRVDECSNQIMYDTTREAPENFPKSLLEKSNNNDNSRPMQTESELLQGSRREGNINNVNAAVFEKTELPKPDLSHFSPLKETSSPTDPRNEHASSVLNRGHEYSSADQQGDIRAVNTAKKADSIYGAARSAVHPGEINSSVYGNKADTGHISRPSITRTPLPPPPAPPNHQIYSPRQLESRATHHSPAAHQGIPAHQQLHVVNNVLVNERHRNSAPSRINQQHAFPEKGDLSAGGNAIKEPPVTREMSTAADAANVARGGNVYGAHQQGNSWNGTAAPSTIYGFRSPQENHASARGSIGVYGGHAEQHRKTPFYPCCAPTVQYGLGPRPVAMKVPEPHALAEHGVVSPLKHPRPAENNYAIGRGRPPGRPDPIYGYKTGPPPPRGLPVGPALGPVGPAPPPFTLGALYQQREGLASIHEQNKQIQAMLRRGEMPPPEAPPPPPPQHPQPLVVRANVAQCLDDGSPLTAIGPDSQYGQHHVVMRF